MVGRKANVMGKQAGFHLVTLKDGNEFLRAKLLTYPSMIWIILQFVLLLLFEANIVSMHM